MAQEYPDFVLPPTSTPADVASEAPKSFDTNNRPIGLALERLANAVPADRHGMLEFDVTTEGTEIEFAQKYGKNWTVSAYGAMDWTGKKAAGVRLRGEW